ncbi:hypothetical protein [Amphibiibacter pelophylacis]|uniref:Uncharacterized protein n=1 Tax=Amphibiibacter pelophylacis TaxID=1799477 RepID=A0ACC6P1W7_9BURK
MKKGILLSLLAIALIVVAVLLMLPVGYFDPDSASPQPDTAAVPAAPDAARLPAIGINGSADPTAPLAPADPNAALQSGQAPAAPGAANPELVERAIQQAERELHSAPNPASDAPIPCDNDLSATSDCPPGLNGQRPQ